MHILRFVNFRTNTFLDQYNKELFVPRGLYCVIVAHEPTDTNTPESPDSPPSPKKKKGSSQLTPQIGVPEWARNLKDPYRKSSSALPRNVAPLTFHEGDSTSSGEVPKKKGLKKLMGNMDNYLDNRALAQYALNNDGDPIVNNQPKRAAFKNRYLDPTHPATTGGIAGLLSGGRVTDKGLDKLCSVSLIQQKILAAASPGTKTAHDPAAGDAFPGQHEQEAREKSRLEAERQLGTQIAGMTVAQKAMKAKDSKKSTNAFNKVSSIPTLTDLHL